MSISGGACERWAARAAVVAAVTAAACVWTARARGDVYWTSAANGGVDIARVAPDGSALDADLITAGAAPMAIASDGTSVYWSQGGSAAGIWRDELDGLSAPSLVAAGVQTDALAVDGQDVYWADSAGSIGRAPLAGGAAQDPWIAGVDARAIAAVNGYVYWTDGGGIGRATVAGAEVDPAYAPVAGGAEQLAVDDEGVYFTEAPADAIGFAFFTDPGSVTTVALAHAPWAITLDRDYLYWSEPDAGAIGRMYLPIPVDPLGAGIDEAFVTGLEHPVGVVAAGPLTPVSTAISLYCPSPAVVGSPVSCDPTSRRTFPTSRRRVWPARRGR